MSDKRETFDSEKNPAIGIALAQLQRDTSAHKEMLGPPEIYATVYNDLATAFMRGMQLVGRPIGPSDIYALQAIEGLAMHVIRPGGPALLSAARGCVIGAGVDIAAGMTATAAGAPQEVPETGNDEDAPPAKPETDDSAEVAALEDALRGEVREKARKPE